MIEIGSLRVVFASTFVALLPRMFYFNFGRSEIVSRFEFRVFLFYSVQLDFELLLALVQHLQAQLPPMKLDARLINVTGDLGPLRFVFDQATFDFFPCGEQHRARAFPVGERWRACRIADNSTSFPPRRGPPPAMCCNARIEK